MRTRPALAAALAALIPAAPLAAAPATGDGPPPPFFHRGPNSFDPEGFPGLRPPALPVPPAEAAPERSAAPDAGAAPGNGAVPGNGTAEAPSPKPPTRAETLDRLFGRLAKARDDAEARGIAGLVERLWMQSGSDTADLLMERAVTAMGGGRRDVAAALLDEIIELRPGWAEAWNKRATLRFLDGDDAGSMEDISHVLAIEPRHFGALSGMGTILARHGEDAAALKALRRALAVYPADAEIRKAVDKLAPTVEGQDL